MVFILTRRLLLFQKPRDTESVKWANNVSRYYFNGLDKKKITHSFYLYMSITPHSAQILEMEILELASKYVIYKCRGIKEIVHEFPHIQSYGQIFFT